MSRSVSLEKHRLSADRSAEDRRGYRRRIAQMDAALSLLPYGSAEWLALRERHAEYHRAWD